MKKAILPMMIILSLGYWGYENRTEFYRKANTSFILTDQAEYVLNANIPDDEILDTFYNKTYDPIYLSVGNEPQYGFRHILARHTTQYFVNFDNKNDASFFPKNIDGGDLIDAMEEFFKNCVDVPLYNRQRRNRQDNRAINRNRVFIGFTEINEQRIKCLLITRRENNQIVTFYPFEESEDVEPDLWRFD